MPYIKAERRSDLRCYEGECEKPQNPGELNYMISKLLREYVGNNPTYEDLNAAIGATEAAKMEFYRRVVIPYEQKKIKENGDMY